MWIKRKLREPLTVYMLLLIALMVQVFASIQFFKEDDAYLNYRMNSKYMIQYAKGMMGNYSYFTLQNSTDPIQQNLKTWAQKGEEVALYARDVFAQRYFQTESQAGEKLPINEDLHILLDLSNLYGFDYSRHGLPRPEILIGEQKWDGLREHYQKLATPQVILDRLLHPYDRYLGEKASEAPILQREVQGYYFYMQKILHYVDIVLSDFPTMQFHSAPPPVLLSQLLANRTVLLAYIVFCIFLTSSQLAEDRQLGSIRLLVSKAHGRTQYFLSSYKGGLLLTGAGLILSFLPSMLLSLFRYGFKGLNYPAQCLPYSYKKLSAFPYDRGQMISSGLGINTRGRALSINPKNFDEMIGSIEIWKLLLVALVFLFLLTSLMLLTGFLVSAFSKNKSITAAIALLPMGAAIMSLYDFRFAATSFPYNPFAAIDIMATASGMQDFTVLSAFFALVAWNLILFISSLYVINRRNLG